MKTNANTLEERTSLAKIYLADVREIAPYAPELMAKISANYPDRARKILSFVREKDRLRSLAAGLLLEEALGARKARAVLPGKYGKPSVEGGPHFNLSHSGDYVLLAVDDVPVGIDIERWTERNCAALAAVSFHEDEFTEDGRAFPAGPAGLAIEPWLFFDRWTLKESYVKMRGTGLSTDMKSFRVVIEGNAARVDGDPGVRLQLSHALEGYSIAVCSGPGGKPARA
ncbi:MAG: 4'-phosphopantetheinyl transferase superfamily protein [Synergistaceae bacterium]|nr:4'-phosphopantetheinyl transferase superfamily protein [Synergistaceae bacterium]